MNPSPVARRRALIAMVLCAFAFAGCNCGKAPADVLDDCQSSLSLPPTVSTDILFVIDDSGSLAEKQQKVKDELHTFVESLVAAPIHNDFQIGVVTTSVTQNAQVCGTGHPSQCTTYDLESGRLQRGKNLDGTVIDPTSKTIAHSTDADFLTLAQQLIGQGVKGSGEEMGLLAARLAVSEPLLSIPTTATPPGNQGFLRAGSRLLIVILSDEDDCSDAHDCSSPDSRLAIQGACGASCAADGDCPGEADYCLPLIPSDPTKGRRCSPNACETGAGRAQLEPVESFVNFFKNMDDGTGAGRHREVFFAVIGAVDLNLHPARCQQGTTEAYGIAQRYRAAVDQMGTDSALIDSICNDSYGATLTKIAELVNAPQTVDLAKPPPDPRMLVFDITHATGEKVTCHSGDGFDYTPPAASAPARATFKGACRLRPGDKLDVKIICAG